MWNVFILGSVTIGSILLLLILLSIAYYS